MPHDAHRSRDALHTPRRLPLSTNAAADPLTSSPPTRRMRSDNRATGSAPAAPSLSASPRPMATTANTATAASASPAAQQQQQQRARSKLATQRRTAVAAPNTSRAAASGATAAAGGNAGSSGALAASPPPPHSLRGRRGEPVSGRGDGAAAQRHTRARKASSGAASARRATGPSTPPALPITNAHAHSTSGLASVNALQRLHEMSVTSAGSAASLSGVVTASTGLHHQQYQAANSSGCGGGQGSELTSPTLPFTPPTSRAAACTSCTLPPMLSHTRNSLLSSNAANGTTPPGRLSLSVPLLPPRHSTPEAGREQRQPHGEPHHVPLLTRFTQLMHPPLYSPVDSLSPPVPPIGAQPQHTAAAPATSTGFSNLSSSTLTDTAVTPRGNYFAWSASGSVSEDTGTPSSHPHPLLHATQTLTAAEAKESQQYRTQSPLQAPMRSGAAAQSAEAMLTSAAPPHATFFPPRTATGEAASPLSADLRTQQQQQQSSSSLTAAGSKSYIAAAPRGVVSSSSASFGSSSAGSPAGSGLRMQPPPPAAAATSAPAQIPHQHVHKGTAPTVALPRDTRTQSTTTATNTAASKTSPAPLRPPGANGGTSRHVSVSAERRPLLAVGAVRAVSKSPTGTPSTEAAKRALKDRRRRELYAWNAMLRLQNESGVQDAV